MSDWHCSTCGIDHNFDKPPLLLDDDTAVEQLARASHKRCIAQWEADRQTDPDRMMTIHDWDAHVPAARKDIAALREGKQR